MMLPPDMSTHVSLVNALIRAIRAANGRFFSALLILVSFQIFKKIVTSTASLALVISCSSFRSIGLAWNFPKLIFFDCSPRKTQPTTRKLLLQLPQKFQQITFIWNNQPIFNRCGHSRRRRFYFVDRFSVRRHS